MTTATLRLSTAFPRRTAPTANRAKEPARALLRRLGRGADAPGDARNRDAPPPDPGGCAEERRLRRRRVSDDGALPFTRSSMILTLMVGPHPDQVAGDERSAGSGYAAPASPTRRAECAARASARAAGRRRAPRSPGRRAGRTARRARRARAAAASGGQAASAARSRILANTRSNGAACAKPRCGKPCGVQAFDQRRDAVEARIVARDAHRLRVDVACEHGRAQRSWRPRWRARRCRSRCRARARRTPRLQRSGPAPAGIRASCRDGRCRRRAPPRSRCRSGSPRRARGRARRAP